MGNNNTIGTNQKGMSFFTNGNPVHQFPDVLQIDFGNQYPFNLVKTAQGFGNENHREVGGGKVHVGDKIGSAAGGAEEVRFAKIAGFFAKAGGGNYNAVFVQDENLFKQLLFFFNQINQAALGKRIHGLDIAGKGDGVYYGQRALDEEENFVAGAAGGFQIALINVALHRFLGKRNKHHTNHNDGQYSQPHVAENEANGNAARQETPKRAFK